MLRYGGLAASEAKPGEQCDRRPTALPPSTIHSGWAAVARLGWGHGKFIAWVAASRARPGEGLVVSDHERLVFLASQSIAVLPLIRILIGGYGSSASRRSAI